MLVAVLVLQHQCVSHKLLVGAHGILGGAVVPALKQWFDNRSVVSWNIAGYSLATSDLSLKSTILTNLFTMGTMTSKQHT